MAAARCARRSHTAAYRQAYPRPRVAACQPAPTSAMQAERRSPVASRQPAACNGRGALLNTHAPTKLGVGSQFSRDLPPRTVFKCSWCNMYRAMLIVALQANRPTRGRNGYLSACCMLQPYPANLCLGTRYSLAEKASPLDTCGWPSST